MSGVEVVILVTVSRTQAYNNIATRSDVSPSWAPDIGAGSDTLLRVILWVY